MREFYTSSGTTTSVSLHSAQYVCMITSVTWSLTPQLAGGVAGGLCPLIAVCPLIGVPVEVPYGSSIRARALYEMSNPT